MPGKKINLSQGEFNEDNAIVVGGNLVDIGTRVVKWYEHFGFDGYTKERVTFDEEDRRTGKVVSRTIKGPRYSKRKTRLRDKSGLGNIRQFFIHHSGGDGKDPENLYNTLYNRRKLSVQHVVEDDGRIYQFNDVADCCWHAGDHNNISTGVECCLYPLAERNPEYYSEERRERTGNLPHSIVNDCIHGKHMRVFAFTTPQIMALAKLAAGTWAALGILSPIGKTEEQMLFRQPPKFPRTWNGKIPRTVAKDAMKHVGLIGHLQCTTRKIDPAGFPWEAFEGIVAERFREFMRNAEQVGGSNG